MSSFPVTSVTLIQKIKTLAPGEDGAAWVRFWDAYSGAIRTFAARKGGDECAEDILMSVFGKLVEVLRSGQYVPEKGAFHSYLSTMILNEVHMLRRKELVRKVDRRVSLDSPIGDTDDEEEKITLKDVITPESMSPDASAAEPRSPEELDDDWRQAILASAIEHVLTKTALSRRDRDVYREYVLEGRPIDEVSKKHGISRNFVSQIKVRINKRIVAVGQELVAGFVKV